MAKGINWFTIKMVKLPSDISKPAIIAVDSLKNVVLMMRICVFFNELLIKDEFCLRLRSGTSWCF